MDSKVKTALKRLDSILPLLAGLESLSREDAQLYCKLLNSYIERGQTLSLDEVGAIVVTGAGRAFCAGMDLENFAGGGMQDAFGEDRGNSWPNYYQTPAWVWKTVPAPVIDRCQVVQLDRYSVEEKVEIARRHILPRLRQLHDITPEMIEVVGGVPEAALALVQCVDVGSAFDLDHGFAGAGGQTQAKDGDVCSGSAVHFFSMAFL